MINLRESYFIKYIYNYLCHVETNALSVLTHLSSSACWSDGFACQKRAPVSSFWTRPDVRTPNTWHNYLKTGLLSSDIFI